MKKICKEILKILITAGLFYYLFKSKVPLSEVIRNIKDINFSHFIIIIVFFFVYYLFFSLRWNFLLTAQKIFIAPLRSYLYILTSFFFNNFLPSGVGMDVVRSAYAGGKKHFEKAFGASLMERALGMVGMMLIGSFAILSGNVEFAKLALLYFGLIILVGFIYLFFTSLKVKWLKEKLLSIKFLNLGESVRKFYRAIKIYKSKWKTIICGIGYSVAVQMVIILINYLIAKGLSISIPFSALIAYIPVITIISLIPITINGLGTREAAYVFFFSSLNIAESEAFSISIIFFAASVVASCAGGIVFIFLSKRKDENIINRKEPGQQSNK